MKQDLPRALEFAMLQTLVAPSNANAWDTLGEAYFASDEVEVARGYKRESKRIQPDFTGGGEAAWKEELEACRKEAAAAPASTPP